MLRQASADEGAVVANPDISPTTKLINFENNRTSLKTDQVVGAVYNVCYCKFRK